MELKEYKKDLTAIFRKNTRENFADGSRCWRIYDEVQILLIEARRDYRASQSYKDLFDLSCRVLQKWAATNMDDSAGQSISFVNEVASVWNVVYEAPAQEKMQDYMMKWFMEEIKKENGDFFTDRIYEYLMKNFNTPLQVQQKMDFLKERIDALEGEEASSCWRKERYMLSRLDLMHREQGASMEELRSYAQQIGTIGAKEALVELEKELGNYDLARGILEELLKEQWEGTPRWEKYMKELESICEAQGDTEERKRIIFAYLQEKPGDSESFSTYRKLFSEEEWKEEWKRILSQMKKGYHKYNLWLAMEGDYERIMENLEVYPSFNSYYNYQEKLETLFPERALRVYAACCEQSMEESINRAGYRRAVKNFCKLSKMEGGEELARELAEKFKSRYPKRTAMLDELSKKGF